MMKIITNSVLAFLVYERLFRAYERREFPYTRANLDRLPQRRIPPALRKKPNFYFYFCHLLRGRVNSDSVMTRMLKLYQENPELFDPYHVVTLTPEIIEEQLSVVFGKLPKARRYGEMWFRNSEILIAWGGDIRNVFKGIRNADQLRRRIIDKKNVRLPPKERGFFLFQEKLCAYLAYLLMDAGLIKPIRIALPADIHHLRVMLGTEMLTVDEIFFQPRTLSDTGRMLAEEYLKRNRSVRPVEFANLLALLSQEGCAKAVKKKPNWNNPKILRRYMKSCGRCPVETRCHHSVVTKKNDLSDDGHSSHLITVIPRPKPPLG